MFTFYSKPVCTYIVTTRLHKTNLAFLWSIVFTSPGSPLLQLRTTVCQMSGSWIHLCSNCT